MKPVFPLPTAGAQTAADKAAAESGTPTELIRSRQLFGDNTRERLIEHAGSLYRLRITQNNKLILTK